MSGGKSLRDAMGRARLRRHAARGAINWVGTFAGRGPGARAASKATARGRQLIFSSAVNGSTVTVITVWARRT